MRILTMMFVALLLSATPAFADIAVDPCEGSTAGAACTLGDGGTGTCVDVSGTLECQAAGTNNGTTGANNGTGGTNAATNATNNGTTPATTGSTANTTTAGTTEEKKGCATVDAGGLAPSLLVFGLILGLRRRPS